MARPMSAINTEFDSRILRVSMGAAGVTRPSVLTSSLEKVYCLHCGKPGGATTVVPPALRGDPGMIYVCLECDGKLGAMPTSAYSFVRYKEG